MDDYLKLVIRLQAIVQNVLVYANNEFDKERYEEIGDIACHLMEYKTDLPFKKNKKKLLEPFISDKIFIPRWFEIIACDYANMKKVQREKRLMEIMDAIYNYDEYEEYITMKIECEKICKKENCSLDDLHYESFPDEIVW